MKDEGKSQNHGADSSVPMGYKKTEVGVIPEDWDVKQLGIIASIATGNTPPTNDVANYGDEFLFVSPVDLGHTKYITCTEKMLSKKGYAISRRFPKDSILFVCIGSTIGKCGIASKELTSNQQINAILPSLFSTNYIYYAVSSVAPKIKSLAGEQAVPIVNKTQFSETVIPLPPTKAEQEAIAGALSDADALIESLEQLIAKKRHIKQGAMQELLTGKKRLPGFQIKPGYKKTEVGVIPEDWGIQTLGEVVSFLDGRRRPVKDSDRTKMQGSIPYYGASGIIDYVKDYLFDEDLILLGEDGENILSRNCRLVFKISGKTWVNNHAHVLKPNTYVSIDFLTDYLETLNYERYNSGTAQPKLNKQTCSGIPLGLPPTKAEQEAIATILSDMDAEITALESKLTKTRALKQGMMHNLLTGKIRLVKPEKSKMGIEA